MRTILILVCAGLVVALLTWVTSALLRRFRGDDGDDGDAVRTSPNPLFWFVGTVAVIVGVVLMASGGLTLWEVNDPFHGEGPEATAHAASVFVWGAVVMVNGVYVWRGARRRGARDRFGRLLIIGGYVLLAVAVSGAVHEAVRMWSATTEQANDHVLTDTMLAFLLPGIPAATLVALGVRTAQEEVLMTAEVEVNRT